MKRSRTAGEVAGKSAGWRWDLGAALLLLVLAGATCSGAIRHSLEIGVDEHYEVTKASLWAGGFRLYGEIWNDQPPLMTILQGLLFMCFGTEAAVARCLAVCFGALLVAGVFHFVRKGAPLAPRAGGSADRPGLAAAAAAAFCLVAAPEVFRLSLSPMLEVPAIGVALWALWPIRRWAEDCRPAWLAGSGLLFAAALQIKLTAMILGPALVVELVLIASRPGREADSTPEAADGTRVRKKPPAGMRGAVRSLGIWGGSLLAGFLLLGALLGSGYGEAWGSHFAGGSRANAAEINRLVFSPVLFLWHTEAPWGLGAALILLVWRRAWRPAMFPLVLLGTALAVHLTYRPFWPFYYLHLALPISWLTGQAIGELVRMAMGDSEASSPLPSLPGEEQWRGGKRVLLAAFFLVAVVVFHGGYRLTTEIGRIRDLPRVEADPLVAAMKKHAGRTRWVYTRKTMVPFHAGLRVIPELAVTPMKRFWSGQMTQPGILAILKRYRPEQVLLDRGEWDAAAREFVKEGYVVACEDSGYTLYVARE